MKKIFLLLSMGLIGSYPLNFCAPGQRISPTASLQEVVVHTPPISATPAEKELQRLEKKIALLRGCTHPCGPKPCGICEIEKDGEDRGVLSLFYGGVLLGMGFICTGIVAWACPDDCSPEIGTTITFGGCSIASFILAGVRLQLVRYTHKIEEDLATLLEETQKNKDIS